MMDAVSIDDVDITDLIGNNKVRIEIDPVRRIACLEGYGLGTGRWTNRVYISLGFYGGPIDGPAVVEMLRELEIQEVLSAICDTTGAQQTEHIERAEILLNDCPVLPEPAGEWYAENWLTGWDCPLKPGADDVDTLAASIVSDALNDLVVLNHQDVVQCIRRHLQEGRNVDVEI